MHFTEILLYGINCAQYSTFSKGYINPLCPPVEWLITGREPFLAIDYIILKHMLPLTITFMK